MTEKIEEKIEYRFISRELLTQALTHSSYANERGCADNERLEFLGDAVLELVTSDFLFREYPDMEEGEMTKRRASLVCEPTLAFCTEELSLGEEILLGKGEELTGGRKRASILSDALEALIGAIYLDGGMDAAARFIRRFILTDIEEKHLFHDSKTILQEKVQGEGGEALSYRLVKTEGPDHARIFTVEALIGEKVYGTGSGPTKKAAEQEAAYRTLLALRS